MAGGDWPAVLAIAAGHQSSAWATAPPLFRKIGAANFIGAPPRLVVPWSCTSTCSRCFATRFHRYGPVETVAWVYDTPHCAFPRNLVTMALALSFNFA